MLDWAPATDELLAAAGAEVLLPYPAGARALLVLPC